MDGEWRQYKDAFLGWRRRAVWQNVGERRYTEMQKPMMVDGRGGEGSGEKREAWTMIEGIRDKGEQPPTGLRHMCG